uniref:Lipase n=1 Tax=Anthurium amnicola TaxID=1678845 RepID=A0A1D1Z4M6_9ARAE
MALVEASPPPSPPPPPSSPPSGESPCRKSPKYLIFRPGRVGVLDVLRLLLTSRRFLDYKFVESSDPPLSVELEDAIPDPNVVVSALLLKVLHCLRKPLSLLGRLVEYCLNLLCLNGGYIGFLRNIVSVSVTFPDKEAASYRSIISLVDGRLDLHKRHSLGDYCNDPLVDLQIDLGEDVMPLDLTTMAAKIAYENPAYVKDAVDNHLQMNFVEFFNCWNKFLQANTTQAFVFTDKKDDANWIFVVFRGTELFDAMDWSVDLDISRIHINDKMGSVHLGFMKALGLQDETDFARGFPKDLDEQEDEEEKPRLAYYAIREALAKLLEEHPRAKVLLTGHSQGGALAVLFSSVLAYHGRQDVLERIEGVVTHGQPRVGDRTFAGYMDAMVKLKYYRTVYRHDIVPRIPFDQPPIFHFRHFGVCVYYDGWYKRKVAGDDEPNPNFFDWSFLGEMFRGAWEDLSDALSAPEKEGKEFEEGWISLFLRMYGLTFPGMAFHSPRDYLNAARLSQVAAKDAADVV